MAITGTHALLYTSEPEQLRAVLRDVFGWDHVDAHDGWLIFALPPAELGVHPAEKPSHAARPGHRVPGRAREPGLRHRDHDGAPRRRRHDAVPAASRHRDL